MKTYLATIAQIKEIANITGNMEGIAAHLTTAQDLRMKAILGAKFLDQLLEQLGTQIVVLGATATNPVEVTTDGSHGFATGDSINIQGATGMTGINGQFDITVTGADTFELDGLDGTLFAAYNAGTATAMRMNEDNVTLLPMIQKPFAWYVLRNAIPQIWMHILNSGLANQGGGSGSFGRGEGGRSASKSEMAYLQQSFDNLATGYEIELTRYLSCNSSKYPLWVGCSTTIYPGDVRQRKKFPGGFGFG